MPSLATRDVEDPRTDRQLENVQQPGDIAAVLLGSEQRLVLEQVVGVEIRRPPFGPCAQKKTGSRYAPKTSSIARRIS